MATADVPSPGVVSRTVSRVRDTIRGIMPATLYSPLQPLPPYAPELSGRMWDFWVGYNLSQLPRERMKYRFHDLRNFSNASDLVRLLIETRKDQVESMPWSIKPKEDKAGNQAKIDQITDFLQYPDGENTWHQWMRALLEDFFVIDAACIYRHRTKGGKLLALDLMDGSQFTIKIDAQGRRPQGNDVAYQQIIQGLVGVDYNADELLYLVHNRRTFTPYGYSPIEQIITTLQILSKRQESQQMYFDVGTMPLASMEMPAGDKVTETQFKAFFAAFTSRLEGNLKERSKIVPILSGSKITEIKQPPLVGKEEEWFARVACFAFKVSPQPFVSMMNRATAQSAKEQSQQEGLAPTLLWFKHTMDRIIREDFGAPDLEFAWLDDREPDALAQMQVDTGYVKAGIKAINEIRDTLGIDPIGEPLYDEPMPLTATGFVPLELSSEPPEPPQMPGNDNAEGGEAEKPKPKAAQKLYGRVHKRHAVKRAHAPPDTTQPVAALKKKSVKYLNPRHLM